MKQLSTTVLCNSAFGLAARMMIKILSFGFSALIVWRPGAEAFGQYAAVTPFGALFLFIADLSPSRRPLSGGEPDRPQFEKRNID
jgi:O-antigen/teichoic acid export membrane protein